MLFLHQQKGQGFLELSASGLLSGPLPSRSCGLQTSLKTLLPTVFSLMNEGFGWCKHPDSTRGPMTGCSVETVGGGRGP